MIKDGQTLHYREWMADDAMREALSTPGVMPKYFKALQEGEEEPPEGFGVLGYRLVHRLPDGRLVQPFIARLGTPEHAIKILDILRGENSLFTDLAKIDSTLLDEINVDKRGQGYYYFQSREVAEDYLKAFAYKTAEKYPFPENSGWFEIYMVQGIAKPNIRGDEGFVMDEMMYYPEPLISIPVSDIYRQFRQI